MQGQHYDFTIPAGGAVQLAVCGSTAKILTASGLVQIQTDTGARVLAMPGQGVRNFDFGKITLVDKSGAVNKGFIWIADADMIDDRITGEVSVIDGGKSRVISGSSFLGVGFAVGTAYDVPKVQLLNPAASGKRIVINQFVIQGESGAGMASIRRYDTPLTENLTVTNLLSKTGNAWAGSAQLRRLVDVTDVGSTWAGRFRIDANGPAVVWKATEPFVLLPGTGCIVTVGTVGIGFTAAIEGYEESAT
jgi:hypothetical protein